MLEMLKERKAALQAEGKKGFTLMEMLIVIAIIAILIAIAIPLFTSQLNAAKAAADESNARALYAQLQADYMLDDIPSGTSLTIAQSGTTSYKDTTYQWSDALTAGTVTIGDSAPTVSITTNGTTYTFPTNPTGRTSTSG